MIEAKLHSTVSAIVFGQYTIVIALLIVMMLTIFVLRRHSTLAQEVEKVLSQKKSSEVRTGKITEVLAPLLDTFPVDVQKHGTSTVFLGQPVDYIHFDPDEGVTFIEIKSGNSELSKQQQKIKECIKDGAVYWEELRIKGS